MWTKIEKKSTESDGWMLVESAWQQSIRGGLWQFEYRNHFNASHIVVSNSNLCACPSLIRSSFIFFHLTNVSVRNDTFTSHSPHWFSISSRFFSSSSLIMNRGKKNVLKYLFFLTLDITFQYFCSWFKIRQHIRVRSAHGKWHVAVQGHSRINSFLFSRLVIVCSCIERICKHQSIDLNLNSLCECGSSRWKRFSLLVFVSHLQEGPNSKREKEEGIKRKNSSINERKRGIICWFSYLFFYFLEKSWL